MGGGGKLVITCPKSISPKLNVIANLVFELANSGIAIQYLSHYTVETLNYKYVWLLLSRIVYVW